MIVHRYFTLLCGVDEAGRGPLAGPVYAACVVLNPARKIEGLADSKTLSEPERERLANEIKLNALAWAVGAASVEEIDKINIFRASLLAMQRALKQIPVVPAEICVDGTHCPESLLPIKAIIKGDACVPQISAASILAKTSRDAVMRAMHERYPLYGFDQHKGYCTREHLAALRRHGVCEIHRRTFAPVRELIDPLPRSRDLPF